MKCGAICELLHVTTYSEGRNTDVNAERIHIIYEYLFLFFII